MNTKSLKLDISNDFIFTRHQNGMKLIRPHKKYSDSSFAVKNIFNFNMGTVYLFHGDSVVIKNNETMANICRYDSINQADGKSIYDIPNSNFENAHSTVINNKQVIRSKRLSVFDEYISLFDEDFHFASVKLPWYNEYNKIIGIFGCSVVVGNQPISDSFGKIIQLLFNPHEISNISSRNKKIGNVYLSKREQDCLRLTVRGNTAKEIANKLNLSPRTIEKYLENIKMKMQVDSKSELIDQAFEYFSFLE